MFKALYKGTWHNFIFDGNNDLAVPSKLRKKKLFFIKYVPILKFDSSIQYNEIPKDKFPIEVSNLNLEDVNYSLIKVNKNTSYIQHTHTKHFATQPHISGIWQDDELLLQINSKCSICHAKSGIDFYTGLKLQGLLQIKPIDQNKLPLPDMLQKAYQNSIWSSYTDSFYLSPFHVRGTGTFTAIDNAQNDDELTKAAASVMKKLKEITK